MIWEWLLPYHLLNFCIFTYKYTENSSIFHLVGYWEWTGICQHAMTRAQKQASPLSYPAARLARTCHINLPPCLNYWPVLSHHYCSLPLLPPFSWYTKNRWLSWRAWRGTTAYAASQSVLRLQSRVPTHVHTGARGPHTLWFPDQTRWREDSDSSGDENTHPHCSCINFCHQHFPSCT